MFSNEIAIIKFINYFKRNYKQKMIYEPETGCLISEGCETGKFAFKNYDSECFDLKSFFNDLKEVINK